MPSLGHHEVEFQQRSSQGCEFPTSPLWRVADKGAAFPGRCLQRPGVGSALFLSLRAPRPVHLPGQRRLRGCDCGRSHRVDRRSQHRGNAVHRAGTSYLHPRYRRRRADALLEETIKRGAATPRIDWHRRAKMHQDDLSSSSKVQRLRTNGKSDEAMLPSSTLWLVDHRALRHTHDLRAQLGLFAAQTTTPVRTLVSGAGRRHAAAQPGGPPDPPTHTSTLAAGTIHLILGGGARAPLDYLWDRSRQRQSLRPRCSHRENRPSRADRPVTPRLPYSPPPP